MKPEDIPQWAWDDADHAMNRAGWYMRSVRIECAKAILQARSQAYEECAKIADEYDGLGKYPSEGSAYGDASLTQMDIAEQIRSKANQ